MSVELVLEWYRGKEKSNILASWKQKKMSLKFFSAVLGRTNMVARF